MTQRTKTNLITTALAVVIGLPIAIYADSTRTYNSWQKPIVRCGAEAEQASEIVENRTAESANPGFNEALILAKMVEACAADQDSYGKRLVADVILNRIHDDRFPDTIAQVVEQEGQFVQLAEFYGAEVDDETYRLCEEELIDQVSYEVIYFDCTDYVTGTDPVLEYGGQFYSR